MAKDRLTGKLAVILHADVAGSTALVQQDEQVAHDRIQDTFRRFGDTITKYHGRVRELRGDALLAEFERASDAVTAALAISTLNSTTVSDPRCEWVLRWERSSLPMTPLPVQVWC
jgi:class 3 adenylate cyclase